MGFFRKYKTIEDLLPGFMLEKEMHTGLKASQSYHTHIMVFVDWLNKWMWNVYKNGEVRYARRMERVGCRQKCIYMHQQILNPPDGYESEHKDRNGLNNKEFNLRIATHQQNQLNRNTWGRSKYRGVTFHKAKLKKGDCEYIQGQIKINGKHVSLGFFKTEEDAALAYNEMAKIYHGEFAYFNIIN